MRIETNVNHYVGVILTEKGIARMREKHEKRNELLGLQEPFYVQQDEEGYTKFQLWDLMRTFGDLFATGEDMPFKATIIFPHAKSN